MNVEKMERYKNNGKILKMNKNNEKTLFTINDFFK